VPRRDALALAGVAWLLLSGPGAAPTAAPSLPPVSAAPPAAARASAPEPTASPGAVDRVRERLRGRRTGLAPHEVEALAHTIAREAARHEIPLELVLAVMHVESRYRAFAVSPVGALGLMQVMPATGREVAEELGIPWSGPRTLFDPHVNVRLGVAYLKGLLQRYGRTEVALAAYNWGPGRIDRRLRAGRPLPVRYVRSVLAAYGPPGPA